MSIYFFFRGFKFTFFMLFHSLSHSKSYFHAVPIFADLLETQISQKYVQHNKVYVHSIYCECGLP